MNIVLNKEDLRFDRQNLNIDEITSSDFQIPISFFRYANSIELVMDGKIKILKNRNAFEVSKTHEENRS